MEGPDVDADAFFDRVLVSIGRRPVSRGIGLENTKVTVDERGFVEIRRSAAHRPIRTSWRSATWPASRCWPTRRPHEGKVAAEVLAGEPAAFDAGGDPGGGVHRSRDRLGRPDRRRRPSGRHQRRSGIAQYPWQASGRATAIGNTDGLTKWIVDPATDRVLGCGIVGIGAGELIAEAVLAIEMGCTVRDVAESIHPHPTLSETVALRARSATSARRPKSTSPSGGSRTSVKQT